MRDLAIVVMCALFLPSVHASQQKVIVLGFDGVDARYTEQWMNERKLPNLARLRQMGTFRPLRPTVPAQTPVSWSTFSTGIDPGRTGIFDFLRRDPKTYLPLFAAFDETKEPFLFGDRNAPFAAAAIFIVLGVIGLFCRGLPRIVVLLRAPVAAGATCLAARRYPPAPPPTSVNP